MNNKGKKYICALAVLFINGILNLQVARAELSLLTPIESAVSSKIKRGAYFLLGIESRIAGTKDELKLLKKNIRTLESKIEGSKEQIVDLDSQIKNLGNLIEDNKQKIRASEMVLAKYENRIINSEKEIKKKEKELVRQISSLSSAINAYYLQTNLFFDAGNNSPLLLAFLSADESTGEILKQNEYLYFMQNSSGELIDLIRQKESEINLEKESLERQKEKTEEMESMLIREKRTLTESQQSRKRLLTETRGKQLIYESLLALSKQEEEQVATTIQMLKNNYSFFQKKIEELKNGEISEEFDSFPQPEEEALLSDAPFSWPVSPALGLTAFFRDEAYRKALGIPHNAVDIRLPQGSKIRAPADGVVTKAADNGLAYSYIILGHAGNFMTLYGHVSEIFVKEGEIIKKGQVIGLSGGIPGTKGAGWLTTGAHLHFEIFKNFQHVDPLDYLPLELVPLSSLPQKYLNRITGEDLETKVKRALDTPSLQLD